MRGYIGGATLDRHVVDRLALGHVFVVQLADILHAAIREQVDLTVPITDDQLLA